MERQTRRRRRPALSCLECRRRKIKCDRDEPCGHCTASKLRCTYRVFGSELTARPPVQQADQAMQSTHMISPLSQAPTIFPAHESTNDVNPISEPVSMQFSRREQSVGDEVSENVVVSGNMAQALVAEPALRDLLHRIQRLEQASTGTAQRSGSEIPQNMMGKDTDSHVVLKKPRVWRWSDWMGEASEFDRLLDCYKNYVKAAANESHAPFPDAETEAMAIEAGTLLRNCKDLARSIKSWQPSRSFGNSGVNLAAPSRGVADVMVGHYLDSFESTYRILHKPTFRAEYQRFWDDPASVKNDARLKILLAIAIGSSLHDPEEVEPGFKRLAHQWIYAAQAWLSGPLKKDRLGINGVQIHCLTILARHIFSIGGDLVWIYTGTLLHTAMQIGLHRDPINLSPMSTLQAEIRRRLWSTILELVIQSSLDAAMPPRISFDEFDSRPPANVNDDELEESQTELQSHLRSTYTDMSLHLQLRDSLMSRLRVAQLLNGIHHELSYHVALELSAEITHACRTNIHFVRQHERSGVSVFHRNLLDFLVRRFLIPLHCPFASQAQTNPLFQYSTKVTLDATITILSPEPDDKFSRLFRIAGGMFREGYRYALATVSHEFIAQAEAQHRDGTLQRNVQQRQFLKKTMMELIEIAAERVRFGGETNIKGHMFLKMIVAQIEAMEMGIPGDLEIAKSAKESLEYCHTLLEEQASTVTPCSTAEAGFGSSGLEHEQGGFGFDWDLDFFLPEGDF
ncbi:C6 zinc finger domain protein [Colletotrichum phormii]|uniref:C6 zinc finger domain protein n=1 Tax=Colletotrichum phormii TaxID=359342 RepID=A0AAJ0EJX2_9PEZI|nr:C6 zinc finger domain protein [Colletotrichum phormii]KAK1654526.1 C6 zinc finger domain protein [Colletotrichum phormii]